MQPHHLWALVNDLTTSSCNLQNRLSNPQSLDPLAPSSTEKSEQNHLLAHPACAKLELKTSELDMILPLQEKWTQLGHTCIELLLADSLSAKLLDSEKAWQPAAG